MKICPACGWTVDESTRIVSLSCDRCAKERDAVVALLTFLEAKDRIRWLLQGSNVKLAERLLQSLGYVRTDNPLSIRWQKPTVNGTEIFYL